MPHQARLDIPGLVHHVMARGIEGRDIFLSNQDHGFLQDKIHRLRHPSIDEILEDIADRSGITTERILGQSRDRKVSQARVEFFRRGHEDAVVSAAELGRMTGLTHVEVVRALKRLKDGWQGRVINMLHMLPASWTPGNASPLESGIPAAIICWTIAAGMPLLHVLHVTCFAFPTC